jgi:hypothetical protein
MKNQYFGDVNDYKKYGLLRILSRNGAMRITVCWMLTESDDRNDGKKTGYLKNPVVWRRFDPELFDSLSGVIRNKKREVKRAEDMGIIPGACYFQRLLFDDPASRTAYFHKLYSFAKESDLIFFDPDNGLEVKSVKKGKRDSSKYIYWDELCRTYELGYSMLVYQHFPRTERKAFINKIKKEIGDRLKITDMVFFQTTFVLFILILQKKHVSHCSRSIAKIDNTWNAGEQPLLKILA